MLHNDPTPLVRRFGKCFLYLHMRLDSPSLSLFDFFSKLLKYLPFVVALRVFLIAFSFFFSTYLQQTIPFGNS